MSCFGVTPPGYQSPAEYLAFNMYILSQEESDEEEEEE